jgi:hypothetical protein
MLLPIEGLIPNRRSLGDGVARDTGYVTRCPRVDGELLRGDPTDDRRLMPLARGEGKRREEKEKKNDDDDEDYREEETGRVFERTPRTSKSLSPYSSISSAWRSALSLPTTGSAPATAAGESDSAVIECPTHLEFNWK